MDDVEITPEMIEAGIEEYALFDFFDPGEWVVAAIYRAMVAKSPRPTSAQIGVFTGSDGLPGVIQEAERDGVAR